jgi:hypothetical protein
VDRLIGFRAVSRAQSRLCIPRKIPDLQFAVSVGAIQSLVLVSRFWIVYVLFVFYRKKSIKGNSIRRLAAFGVGNCKADCVSPKTVVNSIEGLG